MTVFLDQTPPGIDGQLADLYSARMKAQQTLAFQVDEMHRAVGDRRVGSQFGKVWTMDLDALLDAIEKVTDAHRTRVIDTARTNADQARCEVARITADIALLDAEYRRRGGWSRFFLVTNTGGHVHRSMDCQTCFPTTHFAWLPALSGLTEADAVADQGEILCSVCFPSAPSSWTSGISRAARETKEARSQVRAAAAAKKLEKALCPNGEPLELTVDGRSVRIQTLAAGKAWLTDAADWNRYYPRTNDNGSVQVSHPSYPPDAVQTVAVAVGHKTGEAVADVLAAAKKRATKRNRG